MRKYSRLDSIPSGHASEQITEGCVVIEGGGFRGLYNQGVLDAFMMNDLNLECAIGVSAGALAGLSYISGQIGRSARANLGYRHDRDYIGLRAARKSHGAIRLDFLLKDYEAIEPLDRERFERPDRRFIAVATNCRTGKPMFFEKGICSDIISAVKASASLPFVSRMVWVEHLPCLDGGCSCKIPYQWAIDEGYEKIIIIRTRDAEYRKELKGRKTAAKVYKSHPEFAEALDNSNEAYNRQCEEIERLQEEGRVYVVSPSEPVTVGRVEGNMEKLGELYWRGYYDALDHLEGLRAYMKEGRE